MDRDQAHKQNELLLRIAVALEKNTANIVYNGELKNTNEIPGFEGTLDALDNLTSDFHSNKELHEQKLHTDEGPQDDDSIHNDYLNDLVTDMSKEQYVKFYFENNLSFALSDANALTQHIYILEYEECLDAIKSALHITGETDIEEKIGKELGIKVDPYTYETDLQGIRKDDDHDIRSAAHSYEAALDEDLHTKKDCIMDYVTNEFGILGARYTDIIKFAYYLGEPNAPKYDNANRGYYSCAFNTRFGGHLIQGGKDQLVKGINNEGKEKYFALSFVDQATDYYKRIA